MITVKPTQDMPEPDMRDSYDFSAGVRGRYAGRVDTGDVIVLPAPLLEVTGIAPVDEDKRRRIGRYDLVETSVEPRMQSNSAVVDAVWDQLDFLHDKTRVGDDVVVHLPVGYMKLRRTR